MGKFEETKDEYEEELQKAKLLLGIEPQNTQYQFYVAAIQNELGNVLYEMGRFEDAKKRYEEALKIRESLLEAYPENVLYQFNVAMTKGNFGNLLNNIGRFEEAKRKYEEALQSCTSLLEIDPENIQYQLTVVSIQSNIGSLLRIMGRLEEAKNRHEEALKIKELLLEAYPENVQYQLSAATTKNALGNVLYDMGRFEDAKKRYEEALSIKESLLKNDSNSPQYQSDVADSQTNLGSLLYKMNRFEEAKRRYEESLQSYELLLKTDPENSRYQSNVADSQNNLGSLLSEMGQFKEAERRYEEALKIRESLLEAYPENVLYQFNVAMTKGNFGNLLNDIGRFEEAKRRYEEALKIRESLLEAYPDNIQYQLPVVMTKGNLGNLFIEMGWLEEAKRKYEEALQSCTSLLEIDPNNSQYKLNVAMIQTNLGGLLQRQGNYSDAMIYLLDALNLVLKSRDYSLLYNIFYYIGSCYENTGDIKKAYENYMESISRVELIRSQFSHEENKMDIMWDKNAAYSAMISLLCKDMNDVGQAWEFVEKSKSRTLLDFLRFVELEIPKEIPEEIRSKELELVEEIKMLDRQMRTFNKTENVTSASQKIIKLQSELDELYDNKIANITPEYVDLRKGRPLQINGIIELLDTQTEKTAFVEYYTVKDKVFIFVVSSTDKKPKVKVVDLSYEKLLDYLRRYFTEIVEMTGIGDTWEELSEYLIAPVLEDIKDCDIVYIIPYGLLHYLPLHALPIKNKRLIEYFPVVYAPSLTAVKYSQGKVDLSLESCLSLGYTSNKDEKKLFEGEAALVADMFGVEPYLGKKAITSLFSKDARNDVMHISCHGSFNPGDPLESGLTLADKILTAREIFGMDIKTNLLVLSACETGLNKQKPGDELVGLVRAFLYAGAESIIVSLWSVNAESTVEFMKRFYQRIKNKKMTKAKALHEVQIEFIRSKDYSHPYYWAPFILIGDWK